MQFFSVYIHYACIRCLFLINPEDGTKVGQKVQPNGKKKKREAVNARVASLLKKLNDYEWKLR